MAYTNEWLSGAGATVAAIGKALGLPEMGVSEFISGQPAPSQSQSVPSPTTTNNASTIAPAVVKNTGGSSVPLAAVKPTPQSQPSSSSNTSNQQSQLDQQIQDLYNSNNALFDQQASNLQGQANTAKGNVTNQVATATAADQSALQQALDAAKNNQGLLAQTKQSADNQNVRNLNSLQQNLQTRFGAGSSTGLAGGEIIAQEYLRNSGNVQQAYSNGLNQIFSYQADQQAKYNTAIQNLNADATKQMAAIDQSLSDALLQIAQNRVLNEQQKAQQRIQLGQQALANAQAIDNYRIEQQTQMDNWITQQNTLVAQAKADAASAASAIESNAFNARNQINNSSQGSALANPTIASISNYTNPNDKSNDPFSALNPWLSA